MTSTEYLFKLKAKYCNKKKAGISIWRMQLIQTSIINSASDEY